MSIEDEVMQNYADEARARAAAAGAQQQRDELMALEEQQAIEQGREPLHLQAQAARAAAAAALADTHQFPDAPDRPARRTVAGGVLDYITSPSEPANAFQSFMAGLLETGLLGNAGPFLRGAEWAQAQGLPRPLVGFAGGVNAASNTLSGIHPVFGSGPLLGGREENARISDVASENSIAGGLGNLVGAVGPGAAASGLFRGAVLASQGSVPKVANFLTNTVPGRILSNTMVGALEGAVFMHNQEQAAGEGAILGAVGGLVGGTVLGEAFPALYRRFTNSAEVYRARALIEGQIRRLNFNRTPQEQDAAIIREAERLGDLALPADLDPGLYMATQGALSSPRFMQATQPTAQAYASRLGARAPGTEQAPVSVFDNFESEVSNLLPRGFAYRQGDPLDDSVRAFDTAKRNAREYWTSLQPEFDRVLDEASDMIIPADTILQNLHAAANSVSLTQTSDAAYNKMLKAFDFQIKVAKEAGIEGGLSPRHLHALRTELSDMLDDPNIPRPVARIVATAKNSLTSALNEVPGFAELNQRFASEGSYLRAYEMGRNLLKPSGPSQAEIAHWIESANPGDIVGMIEGTSRQLLDNMLRSGGERAVARTLSRDDLVVRKLEEVYGKDVADRLVRAANQALQMSEVSSEMVRNSLTARRVAAGQAFNADAARVTLDVGTFASGLLKELAPSGTQIPGASTAGALGALRRIIGRGEESAEFQQELNRLLSQQGPTRIRAMLEDLQEVNHAIRPRTLGGLDRLLTPDDGSLLEAVLRADVMDSVGNISGLAAAASETGGAARERRRRRQRQRRAN